ncbi:MAG TPA: glycosyltransferase family 39 protein [Desulfobacteraceae bacterium]|nr:glycosyltransferase family 39 protein [Desulfobacteraceae bacterium]HPJ66373.1 glycosyltransferase family 39 protein [Desulfobacteraceae bacterium]HPQ27216.1 glycosyltransferase family 39 protein [Desulfobacteraceae bacterium]
MNLNMTTLPHQKTLSVILFLIVVIFLFLRFVSLNADFPLGITWSGVLFTDEGWYANAALRHYISGEWYLSGDWNPAIPMPLGQVLHRFTFSIFGIGLSSVRITTVVLFNVLVVATALLVRRHFGIFAALLTALLLVTNYVVFAFSRLAVMELIGTSFVVCGLLAAGGYRNNGARLPNLLLASVLIAAGALTKSTMVFAVPLLGYLAWRQGRSNQESLIFLFSSIILVLSLIGVYQIVARTLFPEDTAFFAQLNLYSQMHHSFVDWLFYIPRLIYKIKILGIDLIALTVLSTAIALIISDRYRRNILIHILIGYIAFYLALLSIKPYSPPRYHLPLIVPFAALCAMSCLELREWLFKSRLRSFSIVPILSLIIVFGVSLHGSGKIASYLSAPRYSFYQMAQEVGGIIKKREGIVSKVVLLGKMADSVSLEIATLPINPSWGKDTLDLKLKKYRPQYLIGHRDKVVLEAVKSNGGHVAELASWDVYSNYYGGKRVQLMHVSWN